jgi:DNA-binding MarR family transcriptional regulator
MMQKIHKLKHFKKMPGELPRSEFLLLKTIWCMSEEEEKVTISSLSEQLEITKPAVSQIINSLEDKGFVERITTKIDRRLVYVRLTENGQVFLEKNYRAFLDGMNLVFAKMGEKDAGELLRLITKLYEIIAELDREGNI